MISSEFARISASFRAKARELREQFGSEAAARALEWAASEVEQAAQCVRDQTVSLREASERSGYSVDHLARLVRTGRIPDLRPKGSKGRIRIRIGDLPARPVIAPHMRVSYDPSADARALTGRP